MTKLATTQARFIRIAEAARLNAARSSRHGMRSLHGNARNLRASQPVKSLKANGLSPVLECLDVRPASILVIDGPVDDNTAEEVIIIVREMRRVGGKRVILITSKNHPRHVRLIWRKLVGDAPEAIVSYTPDDPYNLDRWWRNSREALSVTRECMGRISTAVA